MERHSVAELAYVQHGRDIQFIRESQVIAAIRWVLEASFACDHAASHDTHLDPGSDPMKMWTAI